MEDISFWVKVGSTIPNEYIPTKEEGLFIIDDYFSDGLTGVLKSKVMEGHCDMIYRDLHGWLMFIYFASHPNHELTQEDVEDLKTYTLGRIKELNDKMKEKAIEMLDGKSVYFNIWFPEQKNIMKVQINNLEALERRIYLSTRFTKSSSIKRVL